jgi:hypothetical protein
MNILETWGYPSDALALAIYPDFRSNGIISSLGIRMFTRASMTV